MQSTLGFGLDSYHSPVFQNPFGKILISYNVASIAAMLQIDNKFPDWYFALRQQVGVHWYFYLDIVQENYELDVGEVEAELEREGRLCLFVVTFL